MIFSNNGDARDAVTVIVPTRNRAKQLTQTIRSIVRQEGVSLSVVVVDDASSDNTYEVLHEMSDIHVIRHDEPTEQRIARNHGAKVASTPWIAFCDDDDLWAPNKLRAQLDALRSSGADWCTSSAIHVDEGLSPIGGHRLRDRSLIDQSILHKNVVPGGGSGVIMRRELFERSGGFREDARYVEDWDLWIRLSRLGNVAVVDELLVAYRIWPKSFSHSAHQLQYDAFLDLINRYGDTELSRQPLKSWAAVFEVQQRLLSESHASVAKDLPRLLNRSPRGALHVLALLGAPSPMLKWFRLRHIGTKDINEAKLWIAPYSDLQRGAPEVLA
jgi:glycosyltransferase involved in cell wall biosynthesis